MPTPPARKIIMSIIALAGLLIIGALHVLSLEVPSELIVLTTGAITKLLVSDTAEETMAANEHILRSQVLVEE